MKTRSIKYLSFIVWICAIILISACDKAENLLLSDSEKLMKDLKGSYTLVSVRFEEHYSVDGGNNWILSLDTTLSASGSLEINTVNKANYTGNLTVQVGGINETHSINGSASAWDDYDNLWIITDNGEDIQSMLMFNPPASNIEGWLDENTDDHLLLRVSETSVDYSSAKNRYFRFEKD